MIVAPWNKKDQPPRDRGSPSEQHRFQSCPHSPTPWDCPVSTDAIPCTVLTLSNHSNSSPVLELSASVNCLGL